MKDSKNFLKDESDDAIFGDSPAMSQFQDLLHNALVERSAGGSGIAQMLVDTLKQGSGEEAETTPPSNADQPEETER